MKDDSQEMDVRKERDFNAAARKSEGIHYTPLRLASFVADQIASAVLIPSAEKVLNVLDPAVGDGELTLALVRALRARNIKNIKIYGFDTSKSALRTAKKRLQDEFSEIEVDFRCENFLNYVVEAFRDEFTNPCILPLPFDLVIANPPYVRTQVMGADQAQLISQQFKLSGKVDLYHAFLYAIAEVLTPQGIASIVVSNKFMTTKSGACVRQYLLQQFDVQHVWDLGDTKLFDAAVLPAVLLLQKKQHRETEHVRHFTSVYSSAIPLSFDAKPQICEDVLDGISMSGLVTNHQNETYFVEQGELDHGNELAGVWRIRTGHSVNWMGKVRSHTWAKFGDIGKIRVGVKTTADNVFIRDDWHEMPDDERPELLKPLITHHIARRFRSVDAIKEKQILYPHTMVNGRRSAVALDDFPRAARYLEKHRETLEKRTYVIESGRHWYEIWVPQNPGAWKSTKLIFRDITSQPNFWMDLDGSIVNGDCYWLTCIKPENEQLLWLALAVGNSTFITEFYDRSFCNKLYANRRRFCTQYVEHFPLPDPTLPTSQKMIWAAKQIYDAPSSQASKILEEKLDVMTWQAFGFQSKNVAGSGI